MAHNPVNHPARPIYRAIGGLVGVYLVIFGVVGIIETRGAGFLSQDDMSAFGQGTNLAYSVLSVLIGLGVLGAAVVGGNLAAETNKYTGYGLQVIGLLFLAISRTEANVLNFSVSTAIVAMLLGLTLMTAGLYGRVGTQEEHEAWLKARLTA
jgi:hypothetical protein